MAKGDLHISRRFVHSDLNLTESDVKVITNNRIESPFRSMRDSHSVSSFTPDKGNTGLVPSLNNEAGQHSKSGAVKEIQFPQVDDNRRRRIDQCSLEHFEDGRIIL